MTEKRSTVGRRSKDIIPQKAAEIFNKNKTNEIFDIEEEKNDELNQNEIVMRREEERKKRYEKSGVEKRREEKRREEK